MILADKIIENRKKNGWSQEELAEKLGVSRQSVSKWEGAQAVPDMKKIVQLSELFSVSTDYLLKDEIENAPEAAPVDNGLEESMRTVSIEEANEFLQYNEKATSTVSTGVMICIMSPILLIILSGLAEAGRIAASEDTASIGGTAILLIMIAAAVAMFVMTGMRGKKYEYLEKLNIDTEYGVSGMVRERRDRYAETHRRLLIIGIVLCILSAVPLLLTQVIFPGNETGMAQILDVALLLAMVAVGVKLSVLTCSRHGAFDKLLEEGDYTRLEKKVGKYDGIFWSIALAIYLSWSFIGGRWDLTWIVWPIAGVTFAAYREILKAVERRKQ